MGRGWKHCLGWNLATLKKFIMTILLRGGGGGECMIHDKRQIKLAHLSVLGQIALDFDGFRTKCAAVVWATVASEIKFSRRCVKNKIDTSRKIIKWKIPVDCRRLNCKHFSISFCQFKLFELYDRILVIPVKCSYGSPWTNENWICRSNSFPYPQVQIWHTQRPTILNYCGLCCSKVFCGHLYPLYLFPWKVSLLGIVT